MEGVLISDKDGQYARSGVSWTKVAWVTQVVKELIRSLPHARWWFEWVFTLGGDGRGDNSPISVVRGELTPSLRKPNRVATTIRVLDDMRHDMETAVVE